MIANIPSTLKREVAPAAKPKIIAHKRSTSMLNSTGMSSGMLQATMKWLTDTFIDDRFVIIE